MNSTFQIGKMNKCSTHGRNIMEFMKEGVWIWFAFFLMHCLRKTPLRAWE